ncbi:MAG: ABC transporter ATP-binding protein, partial [Chloroflexaceae bacterium]|nr:ABC transporter ATP-binding protein [Chloroflexaceae bacterium]
GKTLGIVGESGSGKSTLGLCLLRLEEPDEGRVAFKGQDIVPLRGEQLRAMRRHMQMVFQDPLDSLNPRLTVGDAVAEPLLLHGIARNRREAREQVKDFFDIVGLPADFLDRYPHQLSGGQRQRVGIARALSMQPELIVLDEPTSALDVSVQATLLNLLTDLQRRFELSYIFISHDLAVISQQADHVAVMYLGQIVETGPTGELFSQPKHPYTMSLLSAIPGFGQHEDHRPVVLEGEIPSPLNPPGGCRLHTRCPFATDACRSREQVLEPIRPGHLVACHRAIANELPSFWLQTSHASTLQAQVLEAEHYLSERRAQITAQSVGSV